MVGRTHTFTKSSQRETKAKAGHFDGEEPILHRNAHSSWLYDRGQYYHERYCNQKQKSKRR